jgi:hypothetical protein
MRFRWARWVPRSNSDYIHPSVSAATERDKLIFGRACIRRWNPFPPESFPSASSREPGFSPARRGISREFCELRLVNPAPALRQVVPVGFHRLNQFYLSAASPVLDLLFATDGSVRIKRALVVHQPGQVVPTGESFHNLGSCAPRRDASELPVAPVYST